MNNSLIQKYNIAGPRYTSYPTVPFWDKEGNFLMDKLHVLAAIGIEKVDSSELEDLCRELLEKNPQIVADVKDGKMQAVGALIGQAKKGNRNANPGEVKRICLELIAGM